MKTTKAKRGRPRKGEGVSQVIRARVSAEVIAAVDKVAAGASMNRSQVVESLLESWLDGFTYPNVRQSSE